MPPEGGTKACIYEAEPHFTANQNTIGPHLNQQPVNTGERGIVGRTTAGESEDGQATHNHGNINRDNNHTNNQRNHSNNQNINQLQRPDRGSQPNPPDHRLNGESSSTATPLGSLDSSSSSSSIPASNDSDSGSEMMDTSQSEPSSSSSQSSSYNQPTADQSEWVDLTQGQDGGVLKRTLSSGQGIKVPNDGAKVTAQFTQLGEESSPRPSQITFTLGEGGEADVMVGLELAVGRMKLHERALVQIKPKYASYGAALSKSELQWVTNSDTQTFTYEVYLKNFVNVKEVWEMTNEELIETSELAKSKGTKYFTEGKIPLAAKMYNRTIMNLMGADHFDGEMGMKRQELLLAGHLNCSLCYLKLNQYQAAIESSNLALKLDPANQKAIFRRGQANFKLHEYEAARSDFLRLNELDPTNKLARSHLRSVDEAIKAHLRREKQMYRNMFERWTTSDQNRRSSAGASSTASNDSSVSGSSSSLRNAGSTQTDNSMDN